MVPFLKTLTLTLKETKKKFGRGSFLKKLKGGGKPSMSKIRYFGTFLPFLERSGGGGTPQIGQTKVLAELCTHHQGFLISIKIEKVMTIQSQVRSKSEK